MNGIIEDKSVFEKLIEVEGRVGSTPLVNISRLSRNKSVSIFAKKEWDQIGGSVKARAAFNIIRHALETGKLTPGQRLLDASSGNTAIAYASILKELEIPVTIVLPENASAERKAILENLGAELILTSPFEGTDGAQLVALELYQSNSDKYFYADQYNNDQNWLAHYENTGFEIFEQTWGTITHFAASLGTTGTFVGTGRRLKELNESVRLVQLQPNAPMHGLEGWKHLETAKTPGIFDAQLADLNLEIDSQEAIDLIPKIYKETGLKPSPSAAASILGTLKLSEQISQGCIVTVLADNNEKYGEIYSKLKLEK